jgi:hypothetical protein
VAAVMLVGGWVVAGLAVVAGWMSVVIVVAVVMVAAVWMVVMIVVALAMAMVVGLAVVVAVVMGLEDEGMVVRVMVMAVVGLEEVAVPVVLLRHNVQARVISDAMHRCICAVARLPEVSEKHMHHHHMWWLDNTQRSKPATAADVCHCQYKCCMRNALQGSMDSVGSRIPGA